MRNPFIAAALAMAAMRTQFMEAVSAGSVLVGSIGTRRGSRSSRQPGPARPAGSKLARKAAAGKIGLRG